MPMLEVDVEVEGNGDDQDLSYSFWHSAHGVGQWLGVLVLL